LIGAGILPLCDIPQIVLSPSFSSFATSFVSISSRLSSGNRSGVGFVGADCSPGTGPGNGLSRSGRTTLVAMLLVTFLVTRPFAIAFPHGVTTVGDAARATLPPGYEVAVKQQMTDEEVWLKLQKIVADTLGVKVENVTPSARFVEDLRAG